MTVSLNSAERRPLLQRLLASEAAGGVVLMLAAAVAIIIANSPWAAAYHYLLHLPLTILFGALLFGLPLPALVKAALNIAATTLVCLVSYHLFVRSTWIGQLLNGKRHPRFPQAPQAAPAQ